MTDVAPRFRGGIETSTDGRRRIFNAGDTRGWTLQKWVEFWAGGGEWETVQRHRSWDEAHKFLEGE